MKRITLPRLPKGFQAKALRCAGGRFDARTGADGAVIDVFDAIGAGGVTATTVAAALRQFRGQALTARINSPGGDLFEGVTIHNLLLGHDAPVTVEVLGIAASAASIIAMAGERILIAKNATMMIHNAQMLAIGDAETMLEAASILKQLDGDMAETYAERTGQSVDAVRELMRAETFMTAEQAIELGFADEILDREAEPAPQVLEEGARAAKIDPANIRELERALCAVIPRSKAHTVAAAGWQALNPPDLSELATLLKTNTHAIRNLRSR